MKFSIIIPVYNVARYLRECLDSVRTQVYTDWEAICVDDGSTVGSGAILEEYRLKDPRFQVIHQVNAGVSVARNAALGMASGEYLVYVDGDDYVSVDYLERLSDEIRKNSNPDILRLRGFHAVSNDGVPQVVALKPLKGSGAFARFCSSILINASLCFLVYRRESFRDIRFPKNVRYGEDDVYMFQGLSRIQALAQSEVDGYYYRHQRVGAASRILTCYDMAIVFNHLRIELLRLESMNGASQQLQEFYRAYINKNLFRVTGKNSRVGDDELRKTLVLCKDNLGPFDDTWCIYDRIRVRIFMRSRTWYAFDFIRCAFWLPNLPFRVIRKFTRLMK